MDLVVLAKEAKNSEVVLINLLTVLVDLLLGLVVLVKEVLN